MNKSAASFLRFLFCLYGLGLGSVRAAVIGGYKPAPAVIYYELAVSVAVVVLVVVLVIVVWRNVTDRCAAAQSLRESESDLAATLESIGDGVITTDAGGRIKRINPVAEKLIGMSAREAIGLPLDQVYKIVDSDSRKRVPSRCQQILAEEEGTAVPVRRTLISRDGGEFIVSESGAPIRDSKGEVVGTVLVCRDISEEARLQDDLRHAQKMEAIGKLAGGISHDFNNLLTSIIGNAELLRISLADDDELSDCAEQIIKSSSQAADVTGQLLTFSRKGRTQMKAVDVHGIINEVINLLGHSIDRRIEIERTLTAGNSWVRGDAGQLQNAFLNLSINARDAMPEGGELTFATHNVTIDPDNSRVRNGEIKAGKYLEVSVRDTGAGIDQKLRERVFEPFFTTKEEGKGTGLGLAVVYGTVRTHRGSVELHNRPSRGTTFVILLPICQPPVEDEPKEVKALAKTTGKGHVLVVDDEEAIRILLARMLKQLGYQATVCADGMEAIDFYARHADEVDLVILDLMMPRMNGETAFKQIRQIDPDARILIVSGFTKSKVVDDLLAAGAAGFLAKPFHLQTISEETRKHLGA